MGHVPRIESQASEPPRPELAMPSRSEPLRLIKKLDQEKRILFTREETHAIDRLVNGLAQRLQAQVKASHVFRALTLLLLQAEGEIDRRASATGPFVRPSNGDSAGLQRFEKELARLLAEGLRDVVV